MVRKLAPELRRRVFEFWLEGKNYREISNATSVSSGAITQIIDEKRKKVPELDELRDLKIALKKADVSVIDAKRGALFQERISALNIQLERIPSIIKLSCSHANSCPDNFFISHVIVSGNPEKIIFTGRHINFIRKVKVPGKVFADHLCFEKPF